MGEENENTKIGIMVDGIFREIEVPELEETTLYDVMQNNSMDALFEQQLKAETTLSIYFKIPNKGLYFLKIMGLEPTAENINKYRHVLQRISPNNWLKMHGIPMRRGMVIKCTN